MNKNEGSSWNIKSRPQLFNRIHRLTIHNIRKNFRTAFRAWEYVVVSFMIFLKNKRLPIGVKKV